MASAGGVLGLMVTRTLRHVVASATKATRAVQLRLFGPLSRSYNVQRVCAPARQPIHPAAVLRHSKRAVHGSSTSSSSSSSSYNHLNAVVRRLLSTAGSALQDRSTLDRVAFHKSNISRAFAQFHGRAPFAHTLRPNLTGGTLPRTASGYASLGAGRIGGQRFFSHAPVSHAQVVQNVSQAMRAFWLSGQRARFDGYGSNGKWSYRPVSPLQDSASKKMAALICVMPGSFIDFHVSPTITALSPLALAAAAAPSFAFEAQHGTSSATLNTEGFLEVLSDDFARQSMDLKAVMNDLQKLAALGDLPIMLENSNTLRVRFPGLDAETLERLCDDVGIHRGIIRQEPNFDYHYTPMSLRLPYAPVAEGAPDTLTSPGGSMESHLYSLSSPDTDEMAFDECQSQNAWLSTPSPHDESELEEYESLSPPHPLQAGIEDGYDSMLSHHFHTAAEPLLEDYEGLTGIYRLITECDQLRSRSRF